MVWVIIWTSHILSEASMNLLHELCKSQPEISLTVSKTCRGKNTFPWCLLDSLDLQKLLTKLNNTIYGAPLHHHQTWITWLHLAGIGYPLTSHEEKDLTRRKLWTMSILLNSSIQKLNWYCKVEPSPRPLSLWVLPKRETFSTYSHVGLHCPPALGTWWTNTAKENQPFLWYLCIYFGYGPLTVTVVNKWRFSSGSPILKM